MITIHWHCRSAQEILDHYDGTRVFVGEGRVNRIEDRVAYTDVFAIGDTLPGGVVAKDADRGGDGVVIGLCLASDLHGAWSACSSASLASSRTGSP